MNLCQTALLGTRGVRFWFLHTIGVIKNTGWILGVREACCAGSETGTAEFDQNLTCQTATSHNFFIGAKKIKSQREFLTISFLTRFQVVPTVSSHFPKSADHEYRVHDFWSNIDVRH